ncbi:hypothetical protein AJ80_01925 [Polytolypa hystricis UAMH7299]|uniref:AA9 family lytic polysaccharide monooxygenase n=1 Tax=Polytolypa hystricis (strain UAMH7299) TaxID=1447883 RepID=A0A2B7Z0S7_POLH7|nr:hypothetical protein AJ80_01925 [Polytolypa hystricis UAMH7299]
MKFTAGLSAALLAGSVSAHTIMTNLVVDGTTYPVSFAVRTPSYDGPITNVNSNDIVCNGGPNPTMSSNDIIQVKAGSTIQGTWRHTLTSALGDVIDASHKGPVMAYLKKVSDARTDSGVGGGWFKITEDGFDGSTWAVDKLISNRGLQSIKIPSCIANGQYLLRTEIIALHGAGQSNGAQFYMECAQIEITGGSGSGNPSTVSLPGAYSSNDPGILLDIYWPPVTSYQIPGPRPFTC